MTVNLESTVIECGPLDGEARVALDVLPATSGDIPVGVLQAYGEPCDVVCVAVPAGDGVAVENAIRRMLRAGDAA